MGFDCSRGEAAFAADLFFPQNQLIATSLSLKTATHAPLGYHVEHGALFEIHTRATGRIAEYLEGYSNRRERHYPRIVKRDQHNSYRIKKPGQHGTRHDAPATIKLVNPALTRANADIAE